MTKVPIRAARSFLVVVFVALSTAAPGAWEADVHSGLTRWLAIKAGFTPAEADEIAFGNQDLDDSTVLSPIRAAILSCLKPDTTTSNTIHDGHFASPLTVRRPPSEREVKKGEVWSRFQSPVLPPPAVRTRADRESLGAFLHALQDSWSHGGIPDTPPPELCTTDLAWGHPWNRGGWSCHLADLTYYWKNDVLSMAQASFDVLTAAVGKGKTWDASLAKEVEEFGRSRDRSSKRVWFQRHGFTAVGFLDDTSLPECLPAGACQSAAYAERAAQWLRSKVGLQFEADIPPAVTTRINRFIQAMLQPDIRMNGMLEVGLSATAVVRSLNVTEACPELLDTYAELMLLDGFRNGYGARQPLLLCELAVANQQRAPMSCRQAVSAARAAIAAKERVGPTLGEMREKLGPAVPLYRSSVARGEKDFVAVVEFVHVPNDVLLLTATEQQITGFAWVARK